TPFSWTKGEILKVPHCNRARSLLGSRRNFQLRKGGENDEGHHHGRARTHAARHVDGLRRHGEEASRGLSSDASLPAERRRGAENEEGLPQGRRHLGGGRAHCKADR